MHVTLRDVALRDLRVFFAHQLDEEATRMAALPSRDEPAFRQHWETKVLGDGTVTKKTILSDGEVAGNILAFERDGKLLVGYWIGRAFWGKGVATAALAQFLEHVKTRPLHAYVAKHNVASIRVLEKCGFAIVATETGDDGIEEVLLELG